MSEPKSTARSTAEVCSRSRAKSSSGMLAGTTCPSSMGAGAREQVAVAAEAPLSAVPHTVERSVYHLGLQRLRELGTSGLQLSGDRQEGALLGAYAPGPQPAGRGMLVQRRYPAMLMQLVWTPPSEPSPGDG
jgi:hypothetical protein